MTKETLKKMQSDLENALAALDTLQLQGSRVVMPVAMAMSSITMALQIVQSEIGED